MSSFVGKIFKRIKNRLLPVNVKIEYLAELSKDVLIIVESSKNNVLESANQLAHNFNGKYSMVRLTLSRTNFLERSHKVTDLEKLKDLIKKADVLYVSSPNSILIPFVEIKLNLLKKVIFYQHGLLNNSFLKAVNDMKKKYSNVSLAVWEDEGIEADFCFPIPENYRVRDYQSIKFSSFKKKKFKKNNKFIFASNAHSPEVDRRLAFRAILFMSIKFRQNFVFCPHPDERIFNSNAYLLAKILGIKISSLKNENIGILVSLPSTVLYDKTNSKFSEKICLL